MSGGHDQRSAAALVAEVREEQPEVVELARALCLAAHAEPAMVRRARLRFVPSSSAGLEALLWFSPLVEAAGSRALVLDPGVAAELRRELAVRSRRMLEEVRAFTEVQHQDAPPAVRVFERLLWAATGEREPSEEAVRRELLPFEEALAREGTQGDEVGRWILHFLPRLPGPVRHSEAAWRLRVAAAERLGLDVPDGAAAGSDPEEVLTARALVRGQVAVGVQLTREGAVLSRPPARDARVCTVAGAARVRLALRGALPGAQIHQLDLYEGQHAAVRLEVVARLLPDGAPAQARVEMDAVVLCAHGGSGNGRAVAVGVGGATVLQLEGDARAVETEVAGMPGLLAVTADGASAAVAVGSTVHLVTVGADGPVATSRELPAPPGALGWLRLGEHPLLCAALGRQVVIHADDGSLLTLDHPDVVVRLWCSTAAHVLATADAAGRVHVWRLNRTGEVHRWYAGEPGGRVTALAADSLSGRICWAAEDGGVRLWEPSDGAVRTLATLPSPATGLALPPNSEAVWAADGGPELRLLGRRASDPDIRRLPFRVREVHQLDDGGLLLTGSGGPLEIGSEDGHLQVAATDHSPPPPAPGPRWLTDSLGVAVAGQSLAGPDAASLLRAARACGAGYLLVNGSLLLPDGPQRHLPAQVAAAGLRLVADLHSPAGHPRDPTPEEAALRTLEEAAALLEHIDGLRLLRADSWPPQLVRDLGHLVDAHPGAALLARVGRAPAGDGTSEWLRACHLVVGPAPDLAAALRPPAPGTGWALPGRPHGGRRLPARSSLLLSLPGCREVSSDVLGDGPEDRRLRSLLRIRAQQLALVRGDAESVDAGTGGVVAVRRRHHDEEVLCLTNTADRAAAARVRRRPGEAALLEVASHRSGEGVAQPSVLHPRADVFEVPVRPGRARWFRVMATAEAVAYGLADGGPDPSRGDRRSAAGS